MFGSQVIDVALGLVLVFLFISIVLTAVQEMIEAWMRSRAGDLNRALYELFQNDAALLQQFYDHPLVFALHRAGLDSDVGIVAVAGSLKTTLDSLKPELENVLPSWKAARAARQLLPSYIPRETFATVVIDLIKNADVKPARLVQAYDAINRFSGGDVSRVRDEIGHWYDSAMDRASGWYKRRTQVSLFLLGLASALLLNINAVVVARNLTTDKQAREYVDRYAASLTANGAHIPTTNDVGGFQAALEDNVSLPIGWTDASVEKLHALFPYRFSHLWTWHATFGALFALLIIIAGYLIPAFAATLGAPFWFDVLNRIMIIRSTVKPKQKSPDEASSEAPATDSPAPDAAGAVTASGAAAPARVAAAAVPPAAAAPPDDPDGCLADHALDEAIATKDADLPAASGGVAHQ